MYGMCAQLSSHGKNITYVGTYKYCVRISDTWLEIFQHYRILPQYVQYNKLLDIVSNDIKWFGPQLSYTYIKLLYFLLTFIKIQ